MLFASLPGRILACACALSALVCPAAAQGGFDAGKAPFAIALDGDPVPYARFFTTVTPGEALTVTLAQDAPEGAYELVQPEGGSVTFADGEAVWRAPDAAGEIRELSVRRAEGGEIALRVFILQPMSAMEGEYLNGYRIGEYPNEALRGLAAYEKPPGFVEVTQENFDTRISPHFTLGQFICKQQQDHWPKYVILNERLILKLEALMADVNAEGRRTDEFFIMSGYRTPWYNRAIGNTTTYSRHVYGGAADVYVDVDPRDGDMDDLDRSGDITIEDAGWLFDRAEQLERSAANNHLVGGLGKYDSNAVHGPFLHVDARGYEARW